MASPFDPMRLLTLNDAVNMCLRSVGRDEVTAYADGEDADVDMALGELNVADLEVQAHGGEGWSFNRDNYVQTQLSPDGTISLPDGLLMVRSSYWNTQANTLPTGSVIDSATPVAIVCERPTGKLYDMVNHTNTFAAAPQVDWIVRQDFEMIPQVFRNYIAILASHRFQAKNQGASIVAQITQQDAMRALAACEQHEDFVSPKNSINSNRGVVSRLYGMLGLRRNRMGQ